MSNLAPLHVDNMNLADAMGFSASTSSSNTQSSLYRITTTVIQEVSPETNKIVSSPVFKIKKGVDEEFLAREVEVRLFAERQRWQRWDSENNTFQKTVMSTNLNGDLKDTLGTFNLGRPTGYVKDFNALPQDMKDLMRSVNRVKVMMGMARVIDPFTEDGGPITDNYAEEIPFVADIKNRDSLKSIDAVVGKLMGKRISPVEHTVALLGDVQAMPTGVKYATIKASMGQRVGFSDGDNDILADFLDYVEKNNEYILTRWEENHTAKLSSEDSAIVSNIVDLEDFE